nr:MULTISPECIES: WGR domain-containing protein [Methylomicrobium]
MLTPVAYLEARDHTRNIHRAYSLSYGQDIFGNWVVETTYGRIGGKGRTEEIKMFIKTFRRVVLGMNQ